MKQLNWYQIFGKSNIPDGRTVEPTDDIQIWLHCANIWDKTYTTLAEVLADTDTLSALIASNNAVDYMVRSTTWATPQALVPHMTSNTTPSGVCSSSSNIATYDPYKAFDGTNTNEYDCWHSDGTVPQWLSYAFTTPTCVSKVSLTSRNMNNNGVMPATFKIQGSNDGVTWDELGSYSWTHGLTGNYTDTFSIPGTDSYLYVRLYGDSAVVSGAKINIGLVQYYSTSISENSTAMTLIGANNYAADTLLADATWCEAICDSEYFESVLNATVPTMTSATTPEGEVGASAYYTGEDPYRAFNGNPATGWTIGSPTRTGWIYYRFVSPVSVKKFTMQNRDENTYYICSPKTFALEGSNDGVTYTSLGNFTNTNNTRAYKCAFNVNNSDEYEYYRLNISDVNQAEGGVCIGELQFYGRKDV